MENLKVKFNINDRVAKLTREMDDQIICYWKLDRKEVEQSLATIQVLNDLKEWLKEGINEVELTSSPIYSDYTAKQTILDTCKQVLLKINELEEQYKCLQ